MGCIRVEKITEYLCDPLRKCLKDEDPYVRKTAAVCVAKLHDINGQMVEELGFLDTLRDLMSDPNPMVVANAVAAITEITETSPAGQGILDLTFQIVNKLLTALNECTEWGQIFILDAISNYSPEDTNSAITICERVSPRLAHANSAVVLSAVKVIVKLIEMMDPSSEQAANFMKKLAPPLVTLLSSEPEIQYVALRNINLVVQKRADIMKQDMKVFFVKYNDPIYVKLEKLDIMCRLTSEANVAQVITELKEYATEVDVDFVRKSVRAIGRCAIKVEVAAEKCVSTLIDLIQTKVNYVVQEAIVVIKDIFRKYPNRYESIIATLCENLDTLDEPEAKASMIWIIGEYAERIDNADELLESFLDGFTDESTQVQLQLLTAIVKLFLKKPTDTQELVQQVLSLATHDSDNPDLRDRGYIYWRLLSTDPAAAKHVVLAEKPLISAETDLIEPTLLDELICHIASLASVYHKPPSMFVEGKMSYFRKALPQNSSTDFAPSNDIPQASVIPESNHGAIGDLLDMDMSGGINNYPGQSSAPAASAVDLLSDGLDMLGTAAVDNNEQQKTTDVAQNIFGAPVDSGLLSGLNEVLGLSQSACYIPPQEVWLPSMKGKGLEISGTFTRRNQNPVMELTFMNKAMQQMSSFAVQFNKNSFGLTPGQQISINNPIMPNSAVNISLPLNTNGPVQKMDPLNQLQVAIKNNVDVFYYSCLIPMHVLFVEDGEMDKRVFLATWKDIPTANEVQSDIEDVQHNADTVSSKLKNNNIFTIAKRNVDGQDMLYQSIKLTNDIWILAELKIQPGNPCFKVKLSISFKPINLMNLSKQSYFQLSLKSRAMQVYEGIQNAYATILHSA